MIFNFLKPIGIGEIKKCSSFIPIWDDITVNGWRTDEVDEDYQNERILFWAILFFLRIWYEIFSKKKLKIAHSWAIFRL